MTQVYVFIEKWIAITYAVCVCVCASICATYAVCDVCCVCAGVCRQVCLSVCVSAYKWMVRYIYMPPTFAQSPSVKFPAFTTIAIGHGPRDLPKLQHAVVATLAQETSTENKPDANHLESRPARMMDRGSAIKHPPLHATRMCVGGIALCGGIEHNPLRESN